VLCARVAEKRHVRFDIPVLIVFSSAKNTLLVEAVVERSIVYAASLSFITLPFATALSKAVVVKLPLADGIVITFANGGWAIGKPLMIDVAAKVPAVSSAKINEQSVSSKS